MQIALTGFLAGKVSLGLALNHNPLSSQFILIIIYDAIDLRVYEVTVGAPSISSGIYWWCTCTIHRRQETRTPPETSR